MRGGTTRMTSHMQPTANSPAIEPNKQTKNDTQQNALFEKESIGGLIIAVKVRGWIQSIAE